MSCTKKSFDIIAINETRIKKQVSLSNNLNLNNYSFEFTPTETVNLLNYNEHNLTNEFLDSPASNSYILLILQPTRITGHFNTLTDHLPQFAIIHNVFGNISGNRSNIYERGWSKYDQENFILDYFSVDWENFLKIDELNSTKMYLDKINMLLDTYALLQRYKLKFKSKPWITLDLQKSISVKNKLLTNFTNEKDFILINLTDNKHSFLLNINVFFPKSGLASFLAASTCDR